MSGREKKERAGAGEDGPWFLTHDIDEDRDRGTELLYNMMEVFGNRANAS